jgi:adenylate cyclase
MVWVIHESMLNSRSFSATIASDDFTHFLFRGDFPYILIFAVTVSFGFNLLLQVRGLLGSGVLFKYLTGKYHKPRLEERFFMFLDLESSTTIAETIGPLKYHSFMNTYFFDINDPIIESKGEIYQYVGDEIVISWSKYNGALNNNCLWCYFRIREKINRLNEKYIKEFGLIPSFGAGLHFGEVVAGEIGDAKKEIVFHGDVMNTTARILSQAKSLSRPLLISEDAVLLLDPYKDLEITFLDGFLLKGKEIKTNLYYAKEKRT